jgi:hypothetical protein
MATNEELVESLLKYVAKRMRNTPEGEVDVQDRVPHWKLFINWEMDNRTVGPDEMSFWEVLEDRRFIQEIFQHFTDQFYTIVAMKFIPDLMGNDSILKS